MTNRKKLPAPVIRNPRKVSASLQRSIFETLERRQYLSTVTIDAGDTADRQSTTAFIYSNQSGQLSLRDALTVAQLDAAQGNTVIVQLGAGLTYSPTTEPTNEYGSHVAGQASSLTTGSIDIEGNRSTIDLSSDGGLQLLNIGGSASVTIDNLAINNGSTGGHGAVTVGGSSNLTVNSTTFTNDSTYGFNGGGATLTDGDQAGGDATGGAVYVGTTGTVTFNLAEFTNDSATGGSGTTTGAWDVQGGSGMGGAVMVGNDAGSTVVFTNSTFTGNTVHGGMSTSTGNGFDPNDKNSYYGMDPNSSGFRYGMAEGGAVYVGAGNTVRFNTATMSRNAAVGRTGRYGFGNGGANGEDGGLALGGAVYATGSTVTFISGEVIYNSATGGTGGDQTHTDTQAGKGGGAAGGAIFVGENSTLTATGGTVISQNAVYGGKTGATKSGVHTDNGNNSPILYVNTIDYGSAHGGAIYNDGAAITLSNASLISNTATGHAGESITFNDHNGEDGGNAYGGAIYMGGGSLTLNQNTTLQANEALGGAGGQSDNGNYDLSGKGGDAQGGAIYQQQGVVTLNSSTLLANTAQAGANGGGQYGVVSTNTSNGPVVDPNRAGVSQGGALYLDLAGSTLNITGSVIQANQAVGTNASSFQNSYVYTGRNGGNAQGGGLYLNTSLTSVNITSSTIIVNSATGGNGGQTTGGGSGGPGGSAAGGGIFTNGGTLQLTTDVLSQNAAFAGLGGPAMQADAGLNGSAAGGGIAANGSVTLDATVLAANHAWGGPKATLGAEPAGAGGNGGDGGSAQGGGIYETAGTLTATQSVWSLNEAFGGNGGAGYDATNGDPDGVYGGSGGHGGYAEGGAIYVDAPTVIVVQASTFRQNLALGGLGGRGGGGSGQLDNLSNDGGKGGAGGIGGDGHGGAVADYDMSDKTTPNLDYGSFASDRFVDNQVGAGDGGNGGNSGFGNNGNTDGGSLYKNNYTGGSGGTAGNGGNGGNALGGAVWDEGAAITFSDTAVSANGAAGGTGGDGGIGGFAGNGEFNSFAGVVERSDYGGNGGQGGNGGNGGDANGGGVAVLDGGVADIWSTSVLNNTGTAGTAGDGGEGGEGGYGAPNGNGGNGGAGGNGGTGGSAAGGGVYAGTDLGYGTIQVGAAHLDNATITGNSITAGGHGQGGQGSPVTSKTDQEQVYASSRAAIVAGEVPADVTRAGYEAGGALGVNAVLVAERLAAQGLRKALLRPSGLSESIGEGDINDAYVDEQSAGRYDNSRYLQGEETESEEDTESSIAQEVDSDDFTSSEASEVDFGGEDLDIIVMDFSEEATDIGTELSLSGTEGLSELGASVAEESTALAVTGAEVGAELAVEAPEIGIAAAEGLSATLIGPEAVLLAGPAIAIGVFFGVAGAAAGTAAFIAEVDGGDPTSAAQSILSIFLQPGEVEGLKYNVGLMFADRPDGGPNPGSAGVNGVNGQDGQANGGGVYAQPTIQTINGPISGSATLLNTIVAGNSATEQHLTVTGQTISPTDPTNPFSGVIVVTSDGQSYASTPLYPILKLVTTTDAANADLAGSITSYSNNLVGVGNGAAWAPSDQVGTVSNPLNAHLIVVQSDPNDPTIPLAEVGGAATVNGGNAFALPGGFDFYNDQLSQPRVIISGGTFAIDIGAVQYAGGPVISVGGDVTTLATATPQTISSFATTVAYNPTDPASPPAVSYSILDDSNAALFTVAPAVSPNGTLTYTLASGVTGSAVITLEAYESGILSLPQVFTITSAKDSTIAVFSTQPAGTVPQGQSVEYDVSVNAAATTGGLAPNSVVQVQVAMPASFNMTSASGSGWTIILDPDDKSLLVANYQLGPYGLAEGVTLPAFAIIGTFTAATALPVLTATDNLPGALQLNTASNAVMNNVVSGMLNAGEAGSVALDPAAVYIITESPTDMLPAGVSFNPVTKTLAGTPAPGTGGAYTLHFTVTPVNGTAAVNNVFTLYVDEPLVVTTAGSLAFTPGTFATYSVSASYYDGTDSFNNIPIYYGTPSNGLALTGTLPAGLSLSTTTVGDTVTLTISGTAAANSVGSYPLFQTTPTDAYLASEIVDLNTGKILSETINLHTQSQSQILFVARATPTVTLIARGGTSVNPIATVTGIGGAVVTDGTITYTYYNSTGQQLASKPTASGTYSVIAYFPGDNNYVPAYSPAVIFKLNRTVVSNPFQGTQLSFSSGSMAVVAKNVSTVVLAELSG